MAVSLNANASAAATAVGVTTISNNNLTIASGSNRVLMVTLVVTGVVTNVAINWDASGTPQAMTLLTSHTSSSSQRQVYVFGLVAPKTGNLTLPATWTTSADADLHATCFDGADQTGSTTTWPTAPTPVNNSTTPASISIPTASGDATYSAIVTGSATVSTPNQTQAFIDNSGTLRGAAQYALSSGSSDTHSWTMGTANWALVGQRIVQFTAGGTKAPPPFATFTNPRFYPRKRAA